MSKRMLLMAAALLTAAGCHGAEHGEHAMMVGRAAPDFELADMNGQMVRLSDFRGKPVLLCFWANGCPPCRAEAPHLTRMLNEHRDAGLVVLAAAVWNEPKEKLEKFAAEKQLTQRILPDGRSLIKTYSVQSIPATFFIDRSGKLVDTEDGFDGPAELETKTRALVGGK